MIRKLKVEELGTAHNPGNRVPAVRLKGRWLAKAGFPAGSRVEVKVYAAGCMDIRLIAPGQLCAGDFETLTESTVAQRRLHAKLLQRGGL